MSLLTRLTVPQPGEAKISPHYFMAALAEYERRATGVNLSSISSFFGLSAGEQDSLQEFLSNIDTTSINRQLIHDVLLLGEFTAYSEATMKRRLGIT